jgi:hypothetical protein
LKVFYYFFRPIEQPALSTALITQRTGPVQVRDFGVVAPGFRVLGANRIEGQEVQRQFSSVLHPSFQSAATYCSAMLNGALFGLWNNASEFHILHTAALLHLVKMR